MSNTVAGDSPRSKNVKLGANTATYGPAASNALRLMTARAAATTA